MRRSTVLEGLQEEAELLLRLLHRQTNGLKHLLLQILIVNTDRTRQQLIAVQHQIICP